MDLCRLAKLLSTHKTYLRYPSPKSSSSGRGLTFARSKNFQGSGQDAYIQDFRGIEALPVEVRGPRRGTPDHNVAATVMVHPAAPVAAAGH